MAVSDDLGNGTQEGRLRLARESARALYDDPDAPVLNEPDGPAECREAVAALSECFTAAGTVAQIIENARAAAQVLSEDRLQGISEIVQNADDSGATSVTFYQMPNALIAVHNGSPLKLADVHALAAPWLTTKSQQSIATGRFGIGLLTLHSLAPAFEMHSGSYDIRLGEPTLSAISPVEFPDAVATPSDTVLRVPLAPGMLQDGALLDWSTSWDASSLLFLRSVEHVRFIEGEDVRTLTLAPGPERRVSLDTPAVSRTVSCRTQTAPDGRAWLVYRADIPSPSGLRRAHKKTDPTTPIGVALPLDSSALSGRLYAGLPVAPTSLPAAISAQFDPVASRRGLAETEWNKAVALLIADLWAAALLDLFQREPQLGWQLVPRLPDPDTARPGGFVNRLEQLVIEKSDTTVANHLRLPVNGALVSVTELAVEDQLLEDILTPAEVASISNLDQTLPLSCRDSMSKWRDVLNHWRAVGVGLPAPVSVSQALPLAEEEARSATSTIALVAAALSAGLATSLANLRCVVLANGTRTSPPSADDLRVLTDAGTGLAATLGLAEPLDPEYLAESSTQAAAIVSWLHAQNSLMSATDDRSLLRRIARAGTRGAAMPAALTDMQAVALRDSLERTGSDDWARLGHGIGRAIMLEAFQYDQACLQLRLTASPAVAYQPAAIDREPASFALAADKTPGLIWVAPKYARVFRSSLGRAGLGAQRFLRILGAETAPRLLPHPGLQQRFASQRKRGLPASAAKSPAARIRALRNMSATYTLDDLSSPDLDSVLENVAADANAERRRDRAAAVLAVLGRDWPTLSEHTAVPAAYAQYGWQVQGSVNAWWLWSAGTLGWLDNADSMPRPPNDLRLRTPATLAVHGNDAAGYLHPAFNGSRPDVLAALGVHGEPDSHQLVARLQQLRDKPEESDNVATDAAVVYQALAARLGRSRASGDLTPSRLRQLFADGAGLIRNNGTWHRPAEVLRGNPVFGSYKIFVPSVPATEPLWAALQIRSPDLDDCLSVITAIGRKRDSEPDAHAEIMTVMLETLRLMATLVGSNAPVERQARRLRKLPLWTTQGWKSSRPVYAIDDPSLTAGIGSRIPVWQPGGELAQFADLLPSLQLHKIEAGDTEIVDAAAGYEDPDLTGLFQDSVKLLHDDLARNDPVAERSIKIHWDLLSGFGVLVSPQLQVHVAGLPDGALTVHIAAKIDENRESLYITGNDALPRVDGGGRAIAGLFSTDPRRLSQAWLAAVEAAREGRRAARIRLASERAATQEADAAAAIAVKLAESAAQAKLAEVRDQATERRSSAQARSDRQNKGRPPTGAGDAEGIGAATSSLSSPNQANTSTRPRILVDPDTLTITGPAGTLVTAASIANPPTRGRITSPDLPEPRADGGPPAQPASPRLYTEREKETLGLEIFRRVLGSDAQDMVDLRRQRGVGADALIDQQYCELKVSAGAEPDEIVLEDSQIRRAMSTSDFFLVVVSGLEGARATPKVRIIVDPLSQLKMSQTSVVKFSGIRQSNSLVYQLGPNQES